VGSHSLHAQGLFCASSHRDTAMALVNQIFLALGWKNAVMQTEVCFAVLCLVGFFFLFFYSWSFVKCSFISCKLTHKDERKLSEVVGKCH